MARKSVADAEPIHIRFKELKSGGKSIYLDIYINGKRKYEFLKLSLLPSNAPGAKEHNEMTMKAANAVKAQRMLDIANNKTPLVLSEKAHMLLTDWLREYKEIRVAQGKSDFANTESTIAHLKRFCPKVKVSEVDEEFIKDYVNYLYKQKNIRTGAPLGKRTIKGYTVSIRAALNYAVECDYISRNETLTFDWSSIRGAVSQREYLTMDEVQKLIDTPYYRTDIRLPFLFACFCGLRISDIRRLKWKDIVYENGKAHINLVQQKTGRTLYLPLSSHALQFLPQEQGQPDEAIFNPPLLTPSVNILSDGVKA